MARSVSASGSLHSLDMSLLTNLTDAVDKLDAATEARDAALLEARRAGHTWFDIAVAARMSPQGATLLAKRLDPTITKRAHELRD